MVLLARLQHKPKLPDSTVQASFPHLLILVAVAIKLSPGAAADQLKRHKAPPSISHKEFSKFEEHFRS